MKLYTTVLLLVFTFSCGLLQDRTPDEIVVDACTIYLADLDTIPKTEIDPEIRKACAAILAAHKQE